MADDSVSATTVINARPEAIFAVLVDPTKHSSIEGTGWVRGLAAEQRTEPLTAVGQVFRMAMYHPNHPNGNYQTANRVRVFDPPSTISWDTGYDADDGTLRFGGWSWRYDLAPAGSASTTVTLTYDWSTASESTRERIGFPPFSPDHLVNSLAHLADLVAGSAGE